MSFSGPPISSMVAFGLFVSRMSGDAATWIFPECDLVCAFISFTSMICSKIRTERLDMKKVRCQAKVVGTVVTVGGAMLMTLYKGSSINFL